MAKQIKRFECPVCLESYNKDIVPKLLPCVHTVCHCCLCSLIKLGKGKKLICPVCRSDIKVPKEGSKAFKTNIYLIPDVEPASMTTNTIVCSFCAQDDSTSFKAFPCGHQLCMTCTKTAKTMNSGTVVASCPVCPNASHNEQTKLYPMLQSDVLKLQDNPTIQPTQNHNSSAQADMMHIYHTLTPEADHAKEDTNEPPLQTEDIVHSNELEHVCHTLMPVHQCLDGLKSDASTTVHGDHLYYTIFPENKCSINESLNNSSSNTETKRLYSSVYSDQQRATKQDSERKLPKPQIQTEYKTNLEIIREQTDVQNTSHLAPQKDTHRFNASQADKQINEELPINIQSYSKPLDIEKINILEIAINEYVPLRSKAHPSQLISVQPNIPVSLPKIPVSLPTPRDSTVDSVNNTIGPVPRRPVRPQRSLPATPNISTSLAKKESNVTADDNQSAIPSAPLLLDWDEMVYETILYVDKTLEEETWYVGGLSRKKSLEILKSYPMLDGLFHVRKSSSGTALTMDRHVYTIDLKYDNTPYHVRIYRNVDGKYHLANKINFPKVFDTVQSLITFHQHQPFVMNHTATGKEIVVTLKQRPYV